MEAVLDTAQVEETPVLVEIYAPWCPWCERMQKEVYANAEIRSYLDEHFTYVRLNGDTNEGRHVLRGDSLTSSQLAATLGARGYPTTVFLRPDGRMIGTLPGFVDAPTFIRVLEYVGTDAYQTQSFQTFMAQQAK